MFSQNKLSRSFLLSSSLSFYSNLFKFLLHFFELLKKSRIKNKIIKINENFNAVDNP